jgi:DNA primase
MKHQHSGEPAGMIFITRFMDKNASGVFRQDRCYDGIQSDVIYKKRLIDRTIRAIQRITIPETKVLKRS